MSYKNQVILKAFIFIVHLCYSKQNYITYDDS